MCTDTQTPRGGRLASVSVSQPFCLFSRVVCLRFSLCVSSHLLCLSVFHSYAPLHECWVGVWVALWYTVVLRVSWGLVRLLVECTPACHSQSSFMIRKKKKQGDISTFAWLVLNHLLYSPQLMFSANGICSYTLFPSQSHSKPRACWDGNRWDETG